MATDLSTTHFELFGLPQSFDVDQEILDRNYRELQRNVHPDRFVNASDQELWILVDPKSLVYLDGTELDYAKEGLNESFQFKNPNVKDECGCGESFTI